MKFQEIARRYRRPILNHVFQALRNLELSEDVTQEILLKVFRFGHRYDPNRPFSGWLWSIVRNSIRDWKRKQRPSLTEINDPDEVESPLPTAETLMIAHDESQSFKRALDMLTPTQSSVLKMRLTERLSYAQIAEHLGISISAAKCSAYRARLVLCVS
jgi:RNA polymerase sigma-70 factor (ECF subfamily)